MGIGQVMIFVILMSFSAVSNDFYNKPNIFQSINNSTKKIHVYPNWADTCILRNEKVTYTYFANQTDEKYLNSCALIYDYSICKSGLITGSKCKDAKWIR